MNSPQQQVAKYLYGRLDPGPARIRLGYVGTSSEVRTPMSRVIQGSRGAREGVVRLRIHLSLLWLADDRGRAPALKLWEWATLIGLDDPLGTGSSRVREALAWLVEEHLVVPQLQSLRLRDERWNGVEYRDPQSAMVAFKAEHDRYPVGHAYFTVSPALWTEGHITRMSARALAAYLILLHRRAYNRSKHNSRSQGVRLPRHLYQEIYTVTPETAKAGFAELAGLGLLTSKTTKDRDYRSTVTYYLSTLEEEVCPPLSPTSDDHLPKTTGP